VSAHSIRGTVNLTRRAYSLFIFFGWLIKEIFGPNPETLLHFVSSLDGVIVTPATRSDLWQTLVEEIEARHFRTWHEYAIEICEALKAVAHSQSLQTL